MSKYPVYQMLPDLFLRAPYYSFAGYDPERLDEVLADQGFRNGLFLASPSFHSILKEKEFDLGRLSEKEKHSVHKYYNRMCFRPTPFGSFASFTLLTWGTGDTVKLGGNELASLHLLPDAKLGAFHVAQADSETIAGPFIKNPTVYLLGDEYRYVKSLIDNSGHYRFSLEAIEADEFYTSLFSFLRQPTESRLLLAWIMEASGSDETQARDFLGFLLDEQLLFHPATGHIIGNIAEGIGQHPAIISWSKYQPLTVKACASLEAIAADTTLGLPAAVQNDIHNYLYAGLERQWLSGGPGEDDAADIGSALELLRRLATPYSSSTLEKFIADFQNRFDREKIPLLTALDPDAGIGYGNFGISGITKGFEDIHVHDAVGKTETMEWTKLHGWLFRLLAEARKEGRFAPLVLSKAYLTELETFTTPGLAPPSIAVMFRKTADQVLVEYAGGAAAAPLIGRFSVFGEETAAMCRRLVTLETEQHPDILFADIGQLSDEHTDNINRRLQLYPYEIPLNVFSLVSDAVQLQPDDLSMFVRDGQLILVSEKYHKRVIPRLASAYNYKHNELAIFRLLCDLQYQGLQANLNFSLERFFPGLDFYPRVVFGRTIISLARWHFNEAETAALKNAASTGNGLSALHDLRERFNLPQKINIGQFDQQLVFDLSCREEALFFLKCIKSMEELIVTEYLAPDRSVKIGHKPFAGQFISFHYHKEKVYDSLPAGLPVSHTKERNFLLGSEWLYVKVWCTPSSADRILARVVLPVVRKNRRFIRKWFFIRYVENGYHIRLRFLVPEEQIGTLLLEFRKQLTASGHDCLVQKYQADIYKREMERYAGMIEEVETYFFAGSELAAHCLQTADEDNEMPSEFFRGLYIAWQLITCFISDHATVKTFTGEMAKAFLKQLNGNKNLKKDMDLKYRSMRAEVEVLLEGPPPVPSAVAESKALIDSAIAIVNKMADEPSERWGTFLADLVHMQLNRIFPVKQRTHEFMVYYFLNKYVISRHARAVQSS